METPEQPNNVFQLGQKPKPTGDKAESNKTDVIFRSLSPKSALTAAEQIAAVVVEFSKTHSAIDTEHKDSLETYEFIFGSLASEVLLKLTRLRLMQDPSTPIKQPDFEKTAVTAFSKACVLATGALSVSSTNLISGMEAYVKQLEKKPE